MSFLLSPIGNASQVDVNGQPLLNGTIDTFISGSSTPAPTYTDINGGTSQANPIVLNNLGLPPDPIWLDSSIVYKFVIKDSTGIIQRTLNDISGVSSTVPIQSEWVIFGTAPSFTSGTSLTLAGDNTSIFHVGRRIKTSNTSGLIYSTITATSFGAGVTTVTVANDSGSLDSGLSQVSYGLLSFTNYSYAPIPRGAITDWFHAAAPLGWIQVVTQNNKAMRVVSGVGGGIGGSVAFTTAFASQAVTGSNSATTLTSAQIPSHTHGIPLYDSSATIGGNTSGTNNGIATGTRTTDGGTGGGGSHNHTFTGTAINLAVQYIDMILASKA